MRIQRIMLELLTNALKYTEKGEVFSARLMENRTKEVIIKLGMTDTEIDIPPDRHHEVYTRFKRLTSHIEEFTKEQD